MRWSSARQCWHDATYAGSNSIMTVARENAALGAAVQGSNWRADRVAHQVECGQVQAVIARLPQDLQFFGNWLYAPYTTEERAHRTNHVAAIVARESDLQSKVPPGQWLPIVIASLYEYARVVLGGDDVRRRSGRYIRNWVRDELGVEIHKWTEPHWRVYDRVWQTLDELDRRALEPVARLVHEQIDLRDSA